MVVCGECENSNPEGCGHFDFDTLRKAPNGTWVCEGCWDEAGEEPRWSDLPRIASLSPAPSQERVDDTETSRKIKFWLDEIDICTERMRSSDDAMYYGQILKGVDELRALIDGGR
jgi:hypothetical protein